MPHYTNTANPVDFPEMFVVCSECGERHRRHEIRATDIEEDFEGRDVITYRCPVTGNETKSLVYVKR